MQSHLKVTYVVIFGQVKRTLFKDIPSMKSLKNIENISSRDYLERAAWKVLE